MGKLYSRSSRYKVFKEAFHPKNSLLSFINILLFSLIMILFFWYIGSQQLYDVLDKKANEIYTMVKNDPQLKITVDDYINNIKNDKVYINKAIKNINERNNLNIDSFYKYFTVPILLMLIIIIYLIYYIISHGYYWNKTEWILVLIMLGAFLTEIIFYFVVIDNFQYVTNSEVLQQLFQSN